MPPSTRTPKAIPIARNRSVCAIAMTTPPASRPIRIAVRETGEATSRSKKPPSMSSANAAPAVVPPIRMPCRIAPAMAKSRKLRTGGKPGMAPGAPENDAVKIAIRTSGKNRPGTSA